MKIKVLLVALTTVAFAAPAAAQTTPTSAGPYLWSQQETDNVVVLAMGTRSRMGANWSATSITVFDLSEVGQVRADAIVEVDCERQVRRTAEIHLYPAADPDQPIGPLAEIPGIEWGPPGPKDGPLMSYICTGEHDVGMVRDSVSAHVAKWRAAR